MNERVKKGCGLALFGGGLAVWGLAALLPPCWGAWWDYGMVIPLCPAGEPRVTAEVSVYGVERGRQGTVSISVAGSWIDPKRGDVRSDAFGDFEPTLELLVDETVHALECVEPIRDRGHAVCRVTFPEDVPDGDHILRVQVDTPLENPVVDVLMPLYAPAHVHVLTDRPLYEPGNEVQFRSLTLRRGSLEPLDQRPGTWTVIDPVGNVLLEERLDGGPWGISHSSFPLGRDAKSGTWTARWTSGVDSGEASFRVQPFTLPRFSVDAAPQKSWYAPGDRPVVSGSVTYSSGAPVQGAVVEVTLSGDGGWPPPTAWLGPHRVMTDAAGSWTVSLPEVPDDLHQHSTVSVYVSAVDTDGDRVNGSARLTLSKDPIQVSAVTELGDGLVADFNNRVYLRVTTPDGRALANREVFLKNAWDVRDEGKTYTTDEDGVLAAQVDPGQPVNVIQPAAPVRPKPKAETRKVTVGEVKEVRAGRDPTLGERRHLEALAERAEACARFGTGQLEMGAEVRGGVIAKLVSKDQEGAMDCVRRALQGQRLGSGDGTWTLRFALQEPRDISWLRSSTSMAHGALPGSLTRELDLARRDATACVAGRRSNETFPWQLVLSVEDERLSTRWVDNPSGAGSWPEKRCVQEAFRGLELEREGDDALAVYTLRVSAWTPPQESGPRTTTLKGFEYVVAVDGLGETAWRSTPGTVPALRIRPDRVLLEPGDALSVEMLRGPSYVEDLPMALTLQGHKGDIQTCARTVDYFERNEENFSGCPSPADDNTVRFVIPEDQTGFMSVSHGDARAVVYVQPSAELELDIHTALGSYAPGSEATLLIETSQPAVVSLVGVDNTLGQLTPLPGADHLSAPLVSASSSMPAYGQWDAVALTSGRIRGSNAQLAAIQRVDVLTLADDELPVINQYATSIFNPEEETMTVFWEVLADVHDAVRAWEAGRGDEVLTNAVMAELYGHVLDERAAQDLPMTDPWGRRLELYMLPTQLLQLVEPRVLVRDATAVPEDVVNWTNWVYEEMEP